MPRSLAADLSAIVSREALSLHARYHIHEELGSSPTTKINMVLAGHSLGGALAVLNTLALLNLKA